MFSQQHMQRLGSLLITKWKSPFYTTFTKLSALAGKMTWLEQGCRKRDVKRSETICVEAQMKGLEEGKRSVLAWC